MQTWWKNLKRKLKKKLNNMHFIKYQPQSHAGYKENGFILRSGAIYFTGNMKTKFQTFNQAEVSYDIGAKLILIKPVRTETGKESAYNRIITYNYSTKGKGHQVIISVKISHFLPTGVYEFISDLEGGLLFKFTKAISFKGN